MVLKRLRQWTGYIVSFVVVALLARMAFDVWRVPDYRGRTAYVSYAPDGRFKASVIPTESRTVLLLQRQEDQRYLAVSVLPQNWVASLSDDNWTCTPQHGCTAYRAGYQPGFVLPPSLWQQFHAWLTIHLRQLEPSHLKDVHRR